MESITDVDVLIVGSGPAGASAALHLVQRDPTWADRILLIDKAVHPRDKLCGGGITYLGKDVLIDLGLEIEVDFFPVREVRLLYHDKAYSFFGNPAFWIVRRSEFDHWLVNKTEARGVTVAQGEGVTDVRVLPHCVEVTTDQRMIRAQVVVAADGSRSFVRRRLKWNNLDASRVARLIEVLTPENEQTQWEFQEGVAVFDFSRLTDGLQGYYWDFPSFVEGKPMMNRGVFDSQAVNRPKNPLKTELRDMMAQRDRTLDEAQIKGHPIRWFDKKGVFSQPRVLLAGDAAGADPLFGEGISFALGYGVPVADAITDAFARHDFSFDTYKKLLSKQWLFRHLDLRVRLARFAYLMKYPRFVKAGWTVARGVIKLTPWRNRDYVPGKLIEVEDLRHVGATHGSPLHGEAHNGDNVDEN